MQDLEQVKTIVPRREDYNEIFEQVRKINHNHKDLLSLYDKAGCYYCCNLFLSINIVDWCDKGNTALCPICGIDAVIPDIDNLTLDFLEELHVYWFSISAYSIKVNDGTITDILDEDELYDPSEFKKYSKYLLERL